MFREQFNLEQMVTTLSVELFPVLEWYRILMKEINDKINDNKAAVIEVLSSVGINTSLSKNLPWSEDFEMDEGVVRPS